MQRECRDIAILCAPTRKRKTTEISIAPTNRRLKDRRTQKKRTLIRGAMSAQLHHRRSRKNSNEMAATTFVFVIRYAVRSAALRVRAADAFCTLAATDFPLSRLTWQQA